MRQIAGDQPPRTQPGNYTSLSHESRAIRGRLHPLVRLRAGTKLLLFVACFIARLTCCQTPLEPQHLILKSERHLLTLMRF